MRRWFLSYHSPDQVLAERLKSAIERQDAGSRVFFAPTGLRAGGYSQPALAKEIDDADAFVLLVGEKGLGSWQALEYYAAHDKHVSSLAFPLVLVLIEGHAAPGLPFLRQLHWIVSADPASERDVAQLIDATGGAEAQSGALWRFTSPYRGLSAMEEKDADYFFGRDRETMEVLNVLAAESVRLPVLLGNSGVGKSSLAQAGVLASLRREAWPERAGTAEVWPHRLRGSRNWCFLKLNPGTEPLKEVVNTLLDTWQFSATDPKRVELQNGWIALLREQKATLRDLLDATVRRHKELDQAEPSAFFLYVDQGEELYARAEEGQRRRFSELIAQSLGDPRLMMLMSMRSDFPGQLQNDEPLFAVHRKIDVPPLRETQLHEVVNRPAELLSARFETDHLAADIARRMAEESAKDAGALPLLSYLLDDMWSAMVARADGVLRLPHAAMELGGVLAERANAFLSRNPHSENALRRVLTLKLATVREDGEPTRRRAARSEFSDEEWRLVSELADHPNRLLVTATPEGGETYAVVAHEAIFRRWSKLREWINQERDFLAWRNELEAMRRRWQGTPDSARNDSLLMGRLALAQAKNWLAKRADDLPKSDRDFINASLDFEALDQRQRERLRARTQVLRTSLVLLVAAALAIVLWSYQWTLKVRTANVLDTLWPSTLTEHAEKALRPKDIFRECRLCPEMVVVPEGEFMMGSRKKVTIASAFAVSRFEVTFDNFDTCVELGGCEFRLFDRNWGRGSQPVINVDWYEAQKYVAWLSRLTGKPYRLLSEAEWEYAARAGSNHAYAWGNELGSGKANCKGCGSKWDGKQPAPVGSFEPNAFGLYDVHGNVSEWVEDCLTESYDAVPADGTPARSGNCTFRVIRGGSWNHIPTMVNLEARFWGQLGQRGAFDGFRVARSLLH